MGTIVTTTSISDSLPPGLLDSTNSHEIDVVIYLNTVTTAIDTGRYGAVKYVIGRARQEYRESHLLGDTQAVCDRRGELILLLVVAWIELEMATLHQRLQIDGNVCVHESSWPLVRMLEWRHHRSAPCHRVLTRTAEICMTVLEHQTKDNVSCRHFLMYILGVLALFVHTGCGREEAPRGSSPEDLDRNHEPRGPRDLDGLDGLNGLHGLDGMAGSGETTCLCIDKAARWFLAAVSASKAAMNDNPPSRLVLSTATRARRGLSVCHYLTDKQRNQETRGGFRKWYVSSAKYASLDTLNIGEKTFIL
jgi:hypothetical protein